MKDEQNSHSKTIYRVAGINLGLLFAYGFAPLIGAAILQEPMPIHWAAKMAGWHIIALGILFVVFLIARKKELANAFLISVMVVLMAAHSAFAIVVADTSQLRFKNYWHFWR